MNLKQLYEENKDSIIMKESKTYPGIFCLKYSRKVFFNNTWNDFLRECRGLVVDKDWNIVVLPFRKIHNYGIEKDSPKFEPDELVKATRKVNGFMIACTWYNNDLLWSTTGSLDSDFVGYAKEIFNGFSDTEKEAFCNVVKKWPNHTFMFECVHPRDPHIVHEEPGLYFIGSRYKDLAEDTFCEHSMFNGTGVKEVESYLIPFADLQKMAAEAKHEGFVFYSENFDRSSKIKSPHYLAKKFLMRGNWKKFLNPRQDFELPEEFIGLRQWILEVERERFFELDEIARREYIENYFLETMK